MSDDENEVKAETSEENNVESFFANILKPGSSLHPTFLAILDGAFVSLLLILVMLAFLTSGSLHVFALIFIELGLWASVKWFVNELQRLPPVPKQHCVEGEEKPKKDQ